MTDDARSRWNARHAARAGDPDAAVAAPARVLTRRTHLLPERGTALDVAGGTGRHAVWLATRGLDATLVDVSDTACDEARHRAAAAGVALEVRRVDLATAPFPAGPWDLVLVHHWLDRDVWRELPGHLAPGGVALLCQPTARNLERHARPSRRWLLEDGEAARYAAAVVADHDGVEVVELVEGWTDEGRHEALVALRRG